MTLDPLEPWERHAGWWQEQFTGGVDPEYEEQILPLARELLAGCGRVLEVGTGEGQVARAVAGAAGSPSAVVGLEPVAGQLVLARRRGGGPDYVQGVAEALPFATGAFDGVVLSLVLEHLAVLEPVLDELARVTAEGGRLVAFLNHPLLQTPGSGWIDDHILEEQYWRVGPYLTPTVTPEEVSPGVVLPFVHRPLSHYVNGLAGRGLVLERMEEPPPPQGFIDRAPEYEAQATIPRLLVLVCRRRGGAGAG